MREVENRIQSFSPYWQGEDSKTYIQALAQAGFYYLGARDRVTCWYCNGCLQNWELNQVPWYEHAKWFPGCEFLLQQKGLHYVREITGQHTDLRRPILRNSAISLTITRNSVHRTFQLIHTPRETNLRIYFC